MGGKMEAWVTAAFSESEIQNALVLCFSLKRVATSRLIALITTIDASRRFRNKLELAFDFTFFMDEKRNLLGLELKDFAKLFAISAARAFKKAMFICPTMLALNNFDCIFEKFGNTNQDLLFLENLDTSIFIFKPSTETFLRIETEINQLKQRQHIGGLKEYLQYWIGKQVGKCMFLSDKHITHFNSEDFYFGNNCFLVNLVKYDKSDNFLLTGSIEEYGLWKRNILKYRNEIYLKHVKPLVAEDNTDSTKLLSLAFDSVSKYGKEPIAIVGMSCRHPSSTNLQEFWNLLYSGKDGTSAPPGFRWRRNESCFHSLNIQNTNAGFLPTPIDDFDGNFFGVSPNELQLMDPQHRLLHELVWEALEDACINPQILKGTLGSVFIGSWLNDYKDILIKSGSREYFRMYMGNSIGASAARISHFLEITGPSIATESGCSSAMVAVHLACKSLQLEETNLALACGVNLLLHPFEKDALPMVVSVDGHCKTFCEKADGFARAEGCAVLVLKRLSDAVRDNDNIWALVKGSAVAQEGLSKSMGTPTVHCESLAMTEALMDGGAEPENISYVETHGTGTIVGDPIEVAAIAKSYFTPRRQKPLIIGSVKTNVGHTESCSGITGIIKTVLSLHYQLIPMHRNFSKLNPDINLDTIPAKIPLTAEEWRRVETKPRLAGVSSFGITGSDVHVILQEAPILQCFSNVLSNEVTKRPLNILKLSTKTEEAMDILLKRYKEYLENSQDSFGDICHSSNIGRADFSHRSVLIANTTTNALKLLTNQKYLTQEVSKKAPKICFLFTGQGSQYLGMARDLYAGSLFFQIHFDFCANILKEKYKIDVKVAMWGGNPKLIHQTKYSQPSIFCVEYALFKLWQSWGVKPDYVLGHSLGEFAATVCAGFLSVEDAITLVAERSLLVDSLPTGKMLAIFADLNQVNLAMNEFINEDLNKKLEYAAINSSEQTVVAGDPDIVIQFADFCKNKCNLRCVLLESMHAFHSSKMEPILEPYENIAKNLRSNNLKFRDTSGYISGVRGKLIENTDVNEKYWVDHTREKVNFLEASKTALELECQIFIEIGPNSVLSAFTMLNSSKNLLCLPSLKKKESDWAVILDSVGKLYLNGVNIDWKGFDQFYGLRKIHSLPSYPFIGKKYWPDLSTSLEQEPIHPLIGIPILNASSAKLFENQISIESQQFLKDHVLGETVVFPGAAFLEMCLAAGYAASESIYNSELKSVYPIKVLNFQIEAPLGLKLDTPCRIQIVVEYKHELKQASQAENIYSVQVSQMSDLESTKTWISHVKANFARAISSEEIDSLIKSIEDPRNIILEANDIEIIEFYKMFSFVGANFGPMFQSIEKSVRSQDGKGIYTKIKNILDTIGQYSYIIHPVLLDALIQSILLLGFSPEQQSKKLYVPVQIGKLIWYGKEATGEFYTYTFLKEELINNELHSNKMDTSSTSECVAVLLDGSGNVLASLSNVEFMETTVSAVEALLEQQKSTMPDLWEEIWRPQVGPLDNRANLKICNPSNFYSEINPLDSFKELNPDQRGTFKDLFEISYLNIVQAFHKLNWDNVQENNEFLEDDVFKKLKIDQKYRKLFAYYLKVLEEEGHFEKENFTWKQIKPLPTLEETTAKLNTPKLSTMLTSKFHSVQLIQTLGENLNHILTGTSNPLSLLFPHNSEPNENPDVSNFYDEYGKYFGFEECIISATSIFLQHWKQVEISSGEKSIMRVLEVGAGTGYYAKHFLEYVEKYEINFEYTYTDISSVFFSTAEKKFQKWGKFLKFKKFNIEEDPVGQGFIPEYYDFVIAADVIHVTKDVKGSLENIKTLLKPNGRLDIVEACKENRIITFIFGILEGYWRFEDYSLRSAHCVLTEANWISVLKSVGYKPIGTFTCVDNFHVLLCSIKENTSLHLKLPQNSIQKKVWLLFSADNCKISEYLKEKISTVNNRNVAVVKPGDNLKIAESNCFLRKEIGSDFEALLKNFEGILEGIVYAWSLEKNISQKEVLQPFFNLAKATYSLKQSSPRVIALTCNVSSPNIFKSSYVDIHTSTIWGFIKSWGNENTGINCRCIDFDREENLNGSLNEQIFYEIWYPNREKQVAFYNKTKHVPKLHSSKLSLPPLKFPTGSSRFQLELPSTNLIPDLKFIPLGISNLEFEQVEIRVKATALNFRDVFNVLKPSEEFRNSNGIGFDFAGVVERIGDNVTKWKIGDKVFGINLNMNSFPSHVKLHEANILSMSDSYDFCEMATLPVAFATTEYSLINIAQIKEKDTVLIHTASGGVGLSAVQICQHVGAKIFATAGSTRKQKYLKSIGVKYVFSSRNTDFSKNILKLTNGEGVDVVLNTLTSEGFKEATLEACGKNARFVEISKLAIWEPEIVKGKRPDVKYTIVDLTKMDEEKWRGILQNLRSFLENKCISPLPYQRFDGGCIRDALDFLQKTKHIGKVICVMPDFKQEAHGQIVPHSLLFNKESSYLITGGLGGIGFVVCKWMVENGAKFILLCGRSLISDSKQTEIDECNGKSGSKIVPVQLDVADFQQCKELLQVKIKELNFPALKGIMHCAGVLKDDLFQNQDWNTFSTALKPKVDGTLNLHRLTRSIRLDHFVLFSSMSSIFGTPGQSNYAAGNNFLDVFAHYRHSIGLPATVVNWGPWGQVGLAADVKLPGVKPFSNVQGINALEYALKSNKTQTCAINILSFPQVSKLIHGLETYIDKTYWDGGSKTVSNILKTEKFWEKYDSKQKFNEKVEVVKTYLTMILRNILKLEESDILPEDQDFREMGVDSLMFVEIKNSLQSIFGSRVSVNPNSLRESNTVNLLSDKLTQIIEGNDEECQQLSNEEIKTLIRQDCFLSEHIKCQHGQGKVAVSEINTILLTGSTGNLGPYILKELTRIPQIVQVICLIRPFQNLSINKRLENVLRGRDILKDIPMEKVVCVSGNIAKARLGLDEKTWEELSCKVDAVFNCAGNVLHLSNYEKTAESGLKDDVRSTNVDGVKNLLEFCCHGNKLKHIFHSGSLLTATKLNSSGVLSEEWPLLDDFDELTTLAYPITKFVGEILIKEAVQERNIPGKIFRFPTIIGDSKTGNFVLKNNHLMLRFLFILKTGMMADNPVPLQTLPVDVCAEAAVKIALDKNSNDCVYNIVHNCPGVEQQFVEIAQKIGYNVEIVEFPVFVEKIREIVTVSESPYVIFKDLYDDQVENNMVVISNNVPCIKQWLLGGGSKNETFFNCQNVLQSIPEFYNNLEKPDEYIYRDLIFAKKEGIFKKYGLEEFGL